MRHHPESAHFQAHVNTSIQHRHSMQWQNDNIQCHSSKRLCLPCSLCARVHHIEDSSPIHKSMIYKNLSEGRQGNSKQQTSPMVCTHDEYSVFIAEQHLVGINAVVLVLMLLRDEVKR